MAVLSRGTTCRHLKQCWGGWGGGCGKWQPPADAVGEWGAGRDQLQKPLVASAAATLRGGTCSHYTLPMPLGMTICAIRRFLQSVLNLLPAQFNCDPSPCILRDTNPSTLSAFQRWKLSLLSCVTTRREVKWLPLAPETDPHRYGGHRAAATSPLLPTGSSGEDCVMLCAILARKAASTGVQNREVN